MEIINSINFNIFQNVLRYKQRLLKEKLKSCNFILIPRVVPKKTLPFSFFVFIFTQSQRWDFLGEEVEKLPNLPEITIIISNNLNLIHESVLLLLFIFRIEPLIVIIKGRENRVREREKGRRRMVSTSSHVDKQ